VISHSARVLEAEFNPANPADSSPAAELAKNSEYTASVVRFRRFDVMPGERRLLCDGQAVEIGSRAFDLLLVLLRSPGALVTKNEIVSHVWPSTVVDESNLRFQMTSLRKALGADRDVIKTIPGRGYLFATEVANEQALHRGLPRGARTVHRASKRADRPLLVVIDDDDATREALDGLLRSFGWRVETYSSVQAFMARPEASPPQCLILDVWMPGRSGLEFQLDLAKAGLEVPVIFISGHADVPMSVRAMKAGAVEFLVKPVRHEELLDAIRSAIGSGIQAS
jgi:DNA-binding response OmpR family regulator